MAFLKYVETALSNAVTGNQSVVNFGNLPGKGTKTRRKQKKAAIMEWPFPKLVSTPLLLQFNLPYAINWNQTDLQHTIFGTSAFTTTRSLKQKVNTLPNPSDETHNQKNRDFNSVKNQALKAVEKKEKISAEFMKIWTCGLSRLELIRCCLISAPGAM